MKARELEGWVEAQIRGPAAPHLIVRSRTVTREAFESVARRTDRGLMFGVACRVHDRSGRVLLVRGADAHSWSHGQWMVPGGGAEPGEDVQAAVRRELWEEAGVRIERLRLWKAYREEVRAPDGRALRWWFFQFVGQAPRGARPRSRVPEEISEVRWFVRLPAKLHFRDDWLRPPRLSRRAAGSAHGRARARGAASR